MKSEIIFHDLKMEIPVKSGIIARYYGELKYIVYNAPYCWFYFADDTKYKVETTIQYMVQNLPKAFVRCNRSAIINICYYREYRIPLSEVEMVDSKVFVLSRYNTVTFNKLRISLPRISPPFISCYTCTCDCNSKTAVCRCKQNDVGTD